MKRIQTYIDDQILEAKFKQHKEELEAELGFKISESHFLNKIITDWIKTKDEQHVSTARSQVND